MEHTASAGFLYFCSIRLSPCGKAFFHITAYHSIFRIEPKKAVQRDVCILKTSTLSCFASFQCVAGACKDSCCVGWEIDVDEESFQRFQKMSGSFGERLRASIVTEEDGTHHYRLKEGDRCPFLNEKGLCEQILACGEDILCEICAEHPRFFRMVGDTQEWGVGLACPEAARLLLSSPQPLAFTEDEPEVENPFLQALLLVRAQLMALAQDRSKSIYDRLSLLLACAELTQEQLDWDTFDAESIVPDEPILPISPGQGGLWLDGLMELEPIDAEWSDALADALAAAQYPELMEDFAEEMEDRAWEYEHLLVYLLFRYVLKAYDDHDLLYWVKSAVWGVLTVEQLSFGRWLRQRKQFSTTDQEDMVRIFSKEVEYDPEIIEGLDPLLEELSGDGLAEWMAE